MPNAPKFMLLFIEAVHKSDVVLPYRLSGIKLELLLLSYVFEAMLSFYVYTGKSIKDQIKSFSIGALPFVSLLPQ